MEKEPFDVLLTDVRLPGIDGIEVVFRALQLQPQLSVLVMTAFGTPEVREISFEAGALEFVEKPVDLDSGVVRLRFGNRRGTLAFEEGQLTFASVGKLKGIDALRKMSDWGEGSFHEITVADLRHYSKNVHQTPAELLGSLASSPSEERDDPGVPRRPGSEQVKRADETGVRTQTDEAVPPVGGGGAESSRAREVLEMAIKDQLDEFTEIQGFRGVAVFSAQGEMVEGFANGKLDIKTAGTFANNALLNAQKATDQMGVGRGNLVQIRAPGASVIMRCLNESTDFAQTSQGKAHFHVVVVLEPEGNVGMASMLLDKVVGKIADELR